MSSLGSWLESKQPALVRTLETHLPGHSGARPLSHPQASALILALAVALNEGTEVLSSMLAQWDQENETLEEPLEGSWAESMRVLRDELWTHLVSEFSPATALTHLKEMEKLMIDVMDRARDLDHHNQARQTDCRLKKAQADLEQMEQRLKEAQEDLRRLEQSKADFISIAAHELKTPLTLIEGYANMMMMELPEEVQGQAAIMLGGIANGTYRLRAIIESMIDISMIDTQVLEINFQPVFLRNITRMATRELSDVLRIRQISLTVEPFPDDGGATFGDPERLHQAVFNVVGNAIKYTPDGRSITIKNTIFPAEDGADENLRGYLDLQVIDTGIGIAPENQERIFNKFSGLGSVALHSTGKYKFKGGGPGLGLAITRGIIHAHGGKIWVESQGYDEEQCPGSTFHIYLPLLNAAPENDS